MNDLRNGEDISDSTSQMSTEKNYEELRRRKARKRRNKIEVVWR